MSLRDALQRSREAHRKVMAEIDSAIAAGLAAGESPSVLAERYGVSRQHVYNVKKAAEPLH